VTPADKKLMAKKRALVVCGPTASGKSELSDALAEELTGEFGARVPTVVVDSMQVYREIPAITNQARRRCAELVGVVSVTEEWTVARHKERAEEVIAGVENTPFVLDCGTGMYLNAIILDVPLAPKVEEQTRRVAQRITAGVANQRRASRAKELELAGAPDRGSIWEGDLRYDTTMIYLRPDRAKLDAAISKRSQRIVRDGLLEAAKIKEMTGVNASVMDAIGVRELVEHLKGKMTIEEAEDRISTRTRKLARRQIRWFDKLAYTLERRAVIKVAQNPADIDLSNCMHDRIRA
jgi:tRNA dimethylallyltransferase